MVYGKTWRLGGPSSSDAHYNNFCRILKSTEMPPNKGWLKLVAVIK